MVLGRIKCFSGRHQFEKNGTVLDKSTPAMESQGFRKIGCFRCPATTIVKRPNVHTKKQIDQISQTNFGQVMDKETVDQILGD